MPDPVDLRAPAMLEGAKALYGWEMANVRRVERDLGFSFGLATPWGELGDDERAGYLARAKACIDAAAENHATMKAAIEAGAAALSDYDEDECDRAAASDPRLAAEFEAAGLVRKPFHDIEAYLRDAFIGRASAILAAAVVCATLPGGSNG